VLLKDGIKRRVNHFDESW